MVIPTSRRPALRAALLSTAVAVTAIGCLDGDTAITQPTSTMAPVRPPTTLMSIQVDGDEQDSQRVDVHAAPMLDDELHLLRSDDPATPFVDGEPAELLRIEQLATVGDCEQLRGTLEFWLALAERDDGEEEEGPDARTASVFARAAYDSIVAVECGVEDDR